MCGGEEEGRAPRGGGGGVETTVESGEGKGCADSSTGMVDDLACPRGAWPGSLASCPAQA